MKLDRLDLEGFAKFVRRRFDFAGDLCVVVGPNEAGKSTLLAAIVATLYGCGKPSDREAFKPWDQLAPFAATLTYTLDDGREFEVQRDFTHDPKGVRVFDRNGNDVSAQTTAGKYVAPGEAHLGMSLEVFLNAACVRQENVAIEGKAASDISTALARALDGGPREHAAESALHELDGARKKYIGGARSMLLKAAQTQSESAQTEAAQARAKLFELADLRTRIAEAQAALITLESAHRENERRKKTHDAANLRRRLDALREVRAELAAALGERQNYDDVAAFPSERVGAIEKLYRRWYEARADADAAAREAERAALDARQNKELGEREADAGKIDDTIFAALSGAAQEAASASDRVATLTNHAAEARRDAEGGGAVLGALVVSGVIVLVGAVIAGVFGYQLWALFALVVALGAIGLGFTRLARRRQRLAQAKRLQAKADEATAAQTKAASTVAAILEPLKIPSVDELGRRRTRLAELHTLVRNAREAAQRAEQTTSAHEAAAQAFDEAVAPLIAVTGERSRDLDLLKARGQRKGIRDGLDARVFFYEQQRAELLRGDSDDELEKHLAALIAAGADPATPIDNVESRRLDDERADIERRLRETVSRKADMEGQLRVAESHVGDIADLDERSEGALEKARSLEAFERALKLARDTIAKHTQEVHEKFARRLEFYADHVMGEVTGGRYGELRVDPQSLAIRLRAPETKRFVALDKVSAGTRDQAYLVVRFAMARMFAEGAETPFILLDDPFVHWDRERVERCLPVLVAATAGGQVILFTHNRLLAEGCARMGAALIDLDESKVTSSP